MGFSDSDGAALWPQLEDDDESDGVETPNVQQVSVSELSTPVTGQNGLAWKRNHYGFAL